MTSDNMEKNVTENIQSSAASCIAALERIQNLAHTMRVVLDSRGFLDSRDTYSLSEMTNTVAYYDGKITALRMIQRKMRSESVEEQCII